MAQCTTINITINIRVLLITATINNSVLKHPYVLVLKFSLLSCKTCLKQFCLTVKLVNNRKLFW